MTGAKDQLDPILAAIHLSNSEVRVHLCRNPFEKDPQIAAEKIFVSMRLYQSTHRDTVLIYLNLLKKTFAIVADEGFSFSPNDWAQIRKLFADKLRNEKTDAAIRYLIQTINERQKHESVHI